MGFVLIYSLNGVLRFVSDGFFVLECGGVGFKCKSDSTTIGELNSLLDSQIKVFTCLVVRESSWELFGFKEFQNVEFFKLLTSITGVGPKASLSILSEFSPNQLVYIISENNAEMLASANGIGAKTAKRILLELKGKIKQISTSFDKNIFPSDNRKEALSALEVLGYSKKDVSGILEKLESSLPVEIIIKSVLEKMSK